MGHIHRKVSNIYMGGRVHRRHLAGMGMGSVLMNKGGAGAGSSYPSIQSYEETTGNKVNMLGNSAAGLGSKLSKLMVKPLTKKPHNIRFEM